ALRSQQALQSKQSLAHPFTIDGQTRTAYEFLFGNTATAAEAEVLRELAESWRRYPKRATAKLQRNLGRRSDAGHAPAAAPSREQPEQFSIGWTYFPNVYEAGRPHLAAWASALTDVESATRQFWPMIVRHGFGYNLIIPERVVGARAGALRSVFGAA